jgi:valyl-tRNA synthetase
MELPTRFEPAAVERRWQAAWQEAKLFDAPRAVTGPRFAIVFPPPNVTGVLTLGHMLGGTVQDTLVRYHRMRGEAVLWVPGADHAGLATQVEVRRHLAKQGVNLDALSPPEIVARVEVWKQEHEARIRSQLHSAGFSFDWGRYRYTMDPGMRLATRRAFVSLYRAGLIYRGDRIVNWDPQLRTAISDLELVRSEEPTELLYVTYPFVDEPTGGIVVATVRPETIFGDVAVAVHPEDPRSASAIGRQVRVPMTDRTVPVIPDPAVDPAFGNGALKVTPAHDVVDFGIARRHPELPIPPSIFDAGARLAGPWVPKRYQGLDRDEARARATAALEEQGAIVRREKTVHSVARSERSKAVVEPMLSTQWFVRMRPLADRAVEAVRRGDVRLHPERWNPTFFRWMEGIEDWCISRQIQWGHPIPVLYCDRCHEVIVEEEPPTGCPKCGSPALRADPDVLDTWFSSWLWPFGALGWPEPERGFSPYYPTSVLVTGRDIVFFWVARMIMAGLQFTGEPPFADVYFTGMLRDAEGRRMSKHLGNSPDPEVMIREWGADALRLSLLFPNPTDQDAAYSPAALEGARNFLTKLWNVVRLLASHLPEAMEAVTSPPATTPDSPLEERWILTRWRRTTEEVEAALSRFELTRAATLLHGFLWHDVADRYVEVAKESLAGRNGETAARRSRSTLLFVVDRTLRELHPMVPHVTEELWHALPHAGEFLALAAWPRPEEAPLDPEAEVAANAFWETVRGIRELRAESRWPHAGRPEASFRPATAELRQVLGTEQASVRRLAQLSAFVLLERDAPSPSGTVSAVVEPGEIYLQKPPEAARTEADGLIREKERLGELLVRARNRLSDEGFRSRAPPEVVRDTEAKAADLEHRIALIDQHLAGTAGEGA